MSTEVIKELLDREPFEPFRIVLSSGECYEVHDPHTVALMKRKVFIALPDGERSVILPYIHIAAIETLHAA